MRWLNGHQLVGATLWGHPLYIWGRAGKALQFFAALTVVLDLIGPESLRAVGRRARRRVFEHHSRRSPFLGTVVMVTAALAWVGFVSYMLVLSLTSTDPFIPRWTAASALVLWTVVAAMAVLVHRIMSRDHWSFKRGLGIWIGAFLLGTLVIPGLLFVLLAMGAFDTLAALLDRARPAHALRWIALVLFLVGFHFDFLAS
ncbi:hypothetical protein ABZ815_22830 [Nonomuraea sp. NPDC047529]|uniref:hypothetical protein n=1 Tax=Nonomuraea sp. NPDC047529 TaxID=3155623 RepID=UPI0033C74268